MGVTCEICRNNLGVERPAMFRAAQSTDQGQNRTSVLICEDHADGWNDGGDWDAPVELVDTEGRTGSEFLTELFECEYCAECSGDAEHHDAAPFLGNWFARCRYAPDDDGNPHPVVKEFRRQRDSESAAGDRAGKANG